MTVTLQLAECTLPETGQVELNIHRSFSLNISADEARRKVNRWLFEKVTMSICAKMPTLVVCEQVVWRVPAFFTSSHKGEVGLVGYVDVNVETGIMNNTAACRKMFLQKAKELAKTLPPFQPRQIDPKYYAQIYEPNIFAPQGNPFEIIADVESAIE